MIEAKKTKNIGSIKINDTEYDIYIAKSEEQKKQGLQHFKKLPSDEGMLFVINESNPVETFFHMHNVPFPLDLVFMDDEFKVLDVKRGNPEDDKIEGVASYVLEVNAGSNIKKGDEADLEDDDSVEYVMKVLGPSGEVQMQLESGERIVSRKETKILIKKALKANASKEDKDYKALGKYIFKVFSGQDNRKPEYVDAPNKKD